MGESSLGKKAKCKKCGEVFVLENADSIPLAIADEGGFAAEAAALAGTIPIAQEPVAEFDPSKLPPPIIERASGSAEDDGDESGYFADLLNSIFLLSSLSNLIIFAILWFIIALTSTLLPMFANVGIRGLLLGTFAQAVVSGWYCAYLFSTVSEAAGGERRLPDFNLDNGLVDDILLPLVRWIGSWVVVLLPAMAYLVVIGGSGVVSVSDSFEILRSEGIAGLVSQGGGGHTLVFVCLVILGCALWPIVILCVAIGGLGTVASGHLMVLTVLRTLPVYIVTVGLVWGGDVIMAFMAGVTDGLGGSIALVGASVYFNLVGMRAVGLYYRHFKHKFPWDWG